MTQPNLPAAILPPAVAARATRLAEAAALLRDGNAPAAEAVFRDMLANQPGDWVALSNLGVALDAQQRFAEAATIYETALAQKPDHLAARFNLGTALLRLGDIAAAVPHLTAVADDPNASPQLRTRATEARLAATARVLAAPTQADEPGLLTEALELRSRGLRDAALDRLRALLRAQPDNGQAAFHAGTECYWAGLADEAHGHFAVALRSRAVTWRPSVAPPSLPKFDRDAARIALFDVLDAIDAHDLAPPFLVYGTALGCVRDGNFISFDSDIDLGVLPGTAPEGLIAALDAHPRLSMVTHDVYRDQIIRLRFAASNGIMGDVFLFHVDAEGWWTGVARGTDAMRWRDAPFGLAQRNFLGRKIWLPDPAEQYLVQNYGDWRTPDPGFVSGLNQPNLIDPRGPLAHTTAYVAIWEAMDRGDASLVARYIREAAALFPADVTLIGLNQTLGNAA